MRIFCSICKEIFIPYSEINVTTCGHLYHGSCISRWYKQHKTCPQCRTTLHSPPFRIYFDVDKESNTDVNTLEHQLETLSDKLRESEVCNKTLRDENKEYEKGMDLLNQSLVTLREKNDNLKTSVRILKEQLCNYIKLKENVTELREEVEVWKAKTNTLQRVDSLVKGSEEEVEKMLKSTPLTQLAVRQLCTYVSILKVQLNKSVAKHAELVKENECLSKAVAEEKKKKSSESEEALKHLKIRYNNLESEMNQLRKVMEEEHKKMSAVKEGDTSSSLNISLNRTQVTKKKPLFKMNFDILDERNVVKEKESKNNSELPDTIKKWEEFVCAGGPSRNLGAPLKKSFGRQLLKGFCKEEQQRIESNYAFDGFGGRKKIRLGDPTPQEEFEKIKKTAVQESKNKKLSDYYQLKSFK